MALNSAALGAAIKQAVKEAFADKSGTDEERSTRVWTNVANAIVTHIQANGVVTVVTACGVGPGTGTGTVS